VSDLEVELVGADAADDVLQVIRAAFAARRPLDPPATALTETLESVTAELATAGGLLAKVEGEPAGALLFEPAGRALALRRFGVLPKRQGSGIAGALIDSAEAHAREHGYDGLRVVARVELPATVAFWERQGFVRSGRDGVNLHLVRVLSRELVLETRADTQALGERLAPRLRAGDLLILTGDLGAGKTTFTQGLGRGLHVRGDITSPTFVIARVHPSLRGGPPLVHVDAYRLGGMAELDDLDLDTSLDDAVTVVEWGEGIAEGLADERLEIELRRGLAPAGASAGASVDDDSVDHSDPRHAVLRPLGERWLGVLHDL